jgi:hypothetical protein
VQDVPEEDCREKVAGREEERGRRQMKEVK